MVAAILVLLLALMPGEPARSPDSYRAFCARHQDLCSGIGAARPASVPRSLLERVNREVNAAILYQRDPADQDAWAIEPARGDCEDFAATKLVRLLAAGVPREAMRLGITRTLAGEGHVVLVVSIDHGAFVLDSLMDETRAPDDVAGTWVGIEGFKNGKSRWYHAIH